MAKRNVVLTGFMGAGKTTVGRILAARLGFGFVDTDAWIVARDGRAIADIFREEGEAAFRAMERAAAQVLAGQTGLVIATGGRLMLDAGNAALLQENGRVFCLTAAPEQIVARALADGTKRPLLDVPDPQEKVAVLLAKRAAAYGRFPQIDTSGKTAEQVADEIAAALASGEREMQNEWTRLPVRVPGGAYDVIVGAGLLPRLRRLAGVAGPVAVVTDSNVGPLYAAQLGAATAVITLPAGEQHKTLDTMRAIYDQLLAAGLDRQGTVVALGGGVVGDMAGFAAATYLRGVDFVQCPTTLLAMVDASVGGKTGVDLPQGKNLVGAFKQQAAVLADIATLSTLPAAELASGMAEVVKHGLIAGGELVEKLISSEEAANFTNDTNFSLIVEAIGVKRDVVQADPFERGRRAVLNLGHTFGHAIEQVSGYAIRHGEGVAMGLAAAANLSARLGHCAPDLQTMIEAVLTRINLPTRIPAQLAAADLYAAMFTDKKMAAGQLRFVLLRGVGDVFVTADVPETAVLETLAEMQS